MSSAVSQRPLRCDAARNRDAVLQAAGDLFAERGVSVAIPEIAARAGVGKATVYRSFATKEALVAAVLTQRLEWMRDRADHAAGAADPGTAFGELLNEIADLQASDRGLADTLALKQRLPQLAEPLREMRRAMDTLVARAQEHGAVRADVTGEEVRTLLGGVSRVLADLGEHDPAVWRRHLRLVVDGLGGSTHG